MRKLCGMPGSEEMGKVGGERTIYLRRKVLGANFAAKMRLARFLLELNCD